MDVCIFGLGRIGLPISLVCADSGMNVTGIDINKDLISDLRDGKAGFDEPGLQEILDRNLGGNFIPKAQDEDIKEDVGEAEYVVLAVGTGFAKYPEEPDLSTLYSIIGQLMNIGLKDKTLILRVTLPIGTSEDVVGLIEEKTDLREGEDFWFAFVPERIMEGRAVEEERNLPKIIGARSEIGFEKVERFFEKIGGELIRVSDPTTAEFIKLVDNSWRNTRFAFANELAYLAEEVGVDVTEAIGSANKGYDRNEIPKPGPVSGYCLGKDPYLLETSFEEIAERRGFNSTWFYGRKANDWLFDKVVDEVEGERVLVAGLSFKANIDDYRYSHSIEIVRKLLAESHEVIVSDPYFDKNEYTRLPDDLVGKVEGFDSLEEALRDEVDTVVLATNHDDYVEFKFEEIVDNRDFMVIDLWNLHPQLADVKEVDYKGLGNDFRIE